MKLRRIKDLKYRHHIISVQTRFYISDVFREVMVSPYVFNKEPHKTARIKLYYGLNSLFSLILSGILSSYF